MADMLRTFVAVKIPATSELEPVLRALAALDRPVAAVAPDKLHVTLKFLGATRVETLARIEERIDCAVGDLARLSVSIEGLGAFPKPTRPSVVWAGLKGAEPLVELAARLESELEPLGFARESRPFWPHLTLARVKSAPPRELLELLRAHATTRLGVVDLREVEFMRSTLGSQGAQHVRLRAWGLR